MKHLFSSFNEQDSKDVPTPGKHFRFDSDESDNDNQVEVTKVTGKVNGSLQRILTRKKYCKYVLECFFILSNMCSEIVGVTHPCLA